MIDRFDRSGPVWSASTEKSQRGPPGGRATAEATEGARSRWGGVKDTDRGAPLVKNHENWGKAFLASESFNAKKSVKSKSASQLGVGMSRLNGILDRSDTPKNLRIHFKLDCSSERSARFVIVSAHRLVYRVWTFPLTGSFRAKIEIITQD